MYLPALFRFFFFRLRNIFDNQLQFVCMMLFQLALNSWVRKLTANAR